MITLTDYLNGKRGPSIDLDEISDEGLENKQKLKERLEKELPGFIKKYQGMFEKQNPGCDYSMLWDIMRETYLFWLAVDMEQDRV